ncbi:hypothetical protein DFA_10431 [Cavenderia fasciculata]|uniref:AB hydrolase-1 domain-containing protein n=1 Tax=Cavenderia fasciculata TaxID=261658 RepID=F4QA70_CACFS|nr:uncharacterized protein DFA_10431 [Cavenderia fasciculata]EGG15589.1 hypothetical protein DFA_10431 [Cavenderia fasciculata]|eukprot:XP_004354331.1 hypothetical protein DFA_10431 [Cavenderia fasciculata]
MKLSTILIVALLVGVSYSQPDVSNSYLGVGDTGVSYFPSYLNLQMHIRCYSNVTAANQNGPIALFDSGLPFFSTAWVPIIPSVLANMPSWNISKACFVDRYGYGWSNSSTYPITTQEYVVRLRGSLQVAGLTGKYILVGWSWGSIFIQTYSLTYPKEVVGILSIDGTDSKWGLIPSNQQNVITLSDAVKGYINMNNMGTLEPLARSGMVGSYFGWLPDALVNSGYTQCSLTASQDIFLDSTNKFLKTAIQEYNIMVISSAILNFTYTIKSTPTPLKDLPYINIYSSYVEDLEWSNRQTLMTSLSTNSQSFEFTTGHYFPFHNPTAIVSGINALANKIKSNPAQLWGTALF